MKRAAQLLILSTLSSLPVSIAAAAEQSAAAEAPVQGYVLYQRLPLTGQITGIAQLQCSGGVCSTKHTTQNIPGTAGTVDLWQDSRITAAMRAKFWVKGGDIAFAGQPAKNALIVLHDGSGAIVATSTLEKPLADLEALFTGASTPTYLVSLDYPVANTAVIVRGILYLDVGNRRIGFATFEGPKSMPAELPNGQTVDTPVPGPESVIAFDTNFELNTDAAAHTAQLTVTSCSATSYIDYKTRATVPAALNLHATYQLHDDVWQRQAKLEFGTCGAGGGSGVGSTAPNPIQQRN